MHTLIVYNKLQGLCTIADIEECVSDVFLDIYKIRHGLDIENTSLKALVSVIAKRRAIDMMRRYYKSDKGQISLDDEAQKMEMVIKTDNTIVEDRIIEKEIRKQLIMEIKSLGHPDSEIFIRKYFFGQSSKEISKALGMKTNTIDKRISRGLAKLRNRMKGVL